METEIKKCQRNNKLHQSKLYPKKSYHADEDDHQNPIEDKYSGIRIFNSRLVNEVKGKATGTPYEKSRLVIQAYNDEGKELILTQLPTIQRASQ
jgi:hypothetical protein